jgi:hypothetical protein
MAWLNHTGSEHVGTFPQAPRSGVCLKRSCFEKGLPKEPVKARSKALNNRLFCLLRQIQRPNLNIISEPGAKASNRKPIPGCAYHSSRLRIA